MAIALSIVLISVALLVNASIYVFQSQSRPASVIGRMLSRSGVERERKSYNLLIRQRELSSSITGETYRNNAKEKAGRKISFQSCDFRVSSDFVLKIDSLDILLPCKIGVVGPNGAGKTTFLRAFAGLRNPSSGIISRDVPITKVQFLTEWPIIFNTTALGNLKMGLSGKKGSTEYQD